MGDNMSADMNIKRIVNTYYCRTDGWKRDTSITRLYEGIVLFTEGEIEYYFENKTFTAKAGDFLFLPGNIPYSGKQKSDYVAFYVIDFECFTKNEFFDVAGYGVFTSDGYDVFRLKFEEAVDIWEKQRTDTNFALKSFIYSIFSDMCKADYKQKNTSPTRDILDYIYKNVADPNLSVSNLCKVFYISESQLRRNIYKYTRLNPNEYILNLRINLAKTKLTYTNDSISDISRQCGFSSPYYFSRCFSESTGLSPSKYRMLTSV